MTEVWHCPKCGRNFSSSGSYANHTCGSEIVGGASDAGYAHERIGKTEGGTGER